MRLYRDAILSINCLPYAAASERADSYIKLACERCGGVVVGIVVIMMFVGVESTVENSYC